MTARSRSPRLPELIAVAMQQAARTPGTTHRMDLRGGARIAIRRTATGTWQLTIARPHVPLGVAEIETFRVNARVPGHATQTPPPGTPQQQHVANEITWYRICWQWPAG